MPRDRSPHAGPGTSAARGGRGTSTSAFGVGKRESHDASGFYGRFRPPELSADEEVHPVFRLDEPLVKGDARRMEAIPSKSVALVVTSPPYFAGKAYEEELGSKGVPADYLAYLRMLAEVFAECVRVLEPGGRIAVNVANLGRRPYRSLATDVTRILQDDLGLLLRGEVVWVKAEGASGSCAWGSFRSASNPVLRDVTERVIIASKGRFDRALTPEQRRRAGLASTSWISNDEFLEATLDLWRIPPESATRVGHPAPFPIELPLRLIDLYTFRDDLVLDPFLGSGTTAVAAALRGRRYAGYDTDGAYVQMARQRVADAEAERQLPPGGPAPEATDAGVAAAAADFQSMATAEGRGARALAESVLERAGFTITARNQRVPGLGITVGLVAEDACREPWHFDVTGAFTTTRGGLVRTSTLWECIGRASLLTRRDLRPLVLLTSHLPARRSTGDRALREVGPATVHDAIEMLSPDGRTRLATYAAGGCRRRPLPGFWTEAELDGCTHPSSTSTGGPERQS